METLIVLVIAAVVGWIAWKVMKKPDINGDGVVDVKDVVAAAQEVVQETKDGAEKAATVAAEKVKKIRKPRAKKAE